MFAFSMDAEQAMLFFTICEELKADTQEKRMAILEVMAKKGQIKGVTKTSMTKDQYVKHLSEKFGNVLVVKKEKQNGRE